jgi:drug/metabolite transporter (DMT)-like permease
MNWWTLSIIVALTVASQDAWVKKSFSHLSAYEMFVYPLLFSLPLFILLSLLAPVPPLQPGFYSAFWGCMPINALAFFLYIKAIKVSPLSLSIPFLAFTPPFAMVTGYLLLGEVPRIWGGIGIVLTCIGGYVLNLAPDRQGFWAPVKAIFHETGSWLMLIVAFLYGFTAVISKKAIVTSSPLFFSMTFFAVHNFMLIVLLAVTGRIRMSRFRQEFGRGALAGLLFFLHALLHGFAVSMTQAAYMISVKRLSILFSIVYGRVFFQERRTLLRLVGASFMLGGATLIALKG